MPTSVRSLAILVAGVAFLSAQTLKRIASLDLPGPGGKRFDYLTIDYDDHYLVSAHLAAGILYVIDTRNNQLVKAIPGVPGMEGVDFVPELKKVYTSDAGDNKIGVDGVYSLPKQTLKYRRASGTPFELSRGVTISPAGSMGQRARSACGPRPIA